MEEPTVITPNDDVGISLMAGEEADAVVSLLRDRLGDALRVSDHVAYVKLETSIGQIEVRFEDAAEVLGRPFTLGQFQVILSSYYGRPTVDDDMFGVYSSMTAGVIANGDH